MKKIYILWLLLPVIFTGCDAVLDKGPLDTFTNSNFWTSEANVRGYANTFYQRFSGYGNGSGSGEFYFNTLSDDQFGNGFTNWTNVTVPASSSNWSAGWTEVRRANIMLEKIPGIESMNDEAKNHWIGVGRMMRAWEYYNLVRMYNDVPWIDKALDITDEGYLYGKRENRDVIMDKVLEDINFACTNMRDQNSQITFTRSLAYAMKAEICLFEGTFRKYRKTEDKQDAPDTQGALKFLMEAKSAANYLMTKDYKLNDTYLGNYNSIDLSNNPEMIFYKAYSSTIFRHSTIAYTCSSSIINGITKSAFDAYLFTDGKPVALTGLDKSDLPMMKILDDGRTVYSISHLLDIRDKRLEQTIDEAVFHVERNYYRLFGDQAMNTTTGYGIKKFDNLSLPVINRNQTNSNYTDAPLFWLSIVYLQYAEAAAEIESLGGEQITQADLDKTINLLKDRAGLPPLSKNVGFSDPANNHGVSDLIWEIRRERRCELILDRRIRYWDLIRWHQIDKLDTTQYPEIYLGANLSTDPDLSEKIVVNQDGYMVAKNEYERVYEYKHYFYPIPSGQIILNPDLGQNPGW